jgi:hypothetical protein
MARVTNKEMTLYSSMLSRMYLWFQRLGQNLLTFGHDVVANSDQYYQLKEEI